MHGGVRLGAVRCGLVRFGDDRNRLLCLFEDSGVAEKEPSTHGFRWESMRDLSYG